MLERVLINLFTAIIEILVILEFCNNFKTKEKKNVVILVVFSALYLIFSVIATIFIPMTFVMLATNIILLLGLTFGYKIKFFKRMFAIFTFLIISVAYEMFVMLFIGTINGITPEQIQADASLYLLVCIICKFALYVTAKALMIFIKPNDKSAKNKYNILNMFFSLTSIGILIVLSYVVFSSTLKVEKILILVVSILLIIANIATFIIYDFGVKKACKVEEQETDIYLLEKQKREYDMLIEMQLKSNKEMHDLKHKMFSVREYIANNDPKAINIIDELCMDFKSKQIVAYTGLVDVDALLNAKMQVALRKDINLKYNIFIDSKIVMDSMDLCVLYGNLVDNAIESCEKMEGVKTFISLDVRTKCDFLAVKCTNSTNMKKVRIGKSSKEKVKMRHGFGMAKMEELAKKYYGNLEYFIQKDIFCISILMKNYDVH